MSKISIVGSGFSSLSAACYLAKEGFEVNVFEKNTTLGGRARQLEKEGFKFDIGPTWYWMPDVFERFFSDFGHKPTDFYQLIKMSPGYKVYFGKGDTIDISDSIDDIYEVFEAEEKGAAQKLKNFLELAEKNYRIGVCDIVYRPGLSPLELITKDTVLEVHQFFRSIDSYVKKHFKSNKLRQILEFPVLFLGAKPQDTPLFYSFMNYADFVLGTWYPDGGMYSVTLGMIELAKQLGVEFHTGANVEKIVVENKKSKGLIINGKLVESDIIVSGADYNHTESLLEEKNRSYSKKFWSKKIMAPSALLFYVGFSEPIKNVNHHTLFFDVSFDDHAVEIYDNPKWPEKPLFYASFPTKTDKKIAPVGKEAGIFLIPLAPNLQDTPELREKYFKIIMDRLADLTSQEIMSKVLFKESYCINDFKEDYNSFKGNAYGMAMTLMQTAYLRPSLKSKKVKNLFLTGQLTVPGPGVPPALISGKLVAELVSKHAKKKNQKTQLEQT